MKRKIIIIIILLLAIFFVAVIKSFKNEEVVTAKEFKGTVLNKDTENIKVKNDNDEIYYLHYKTDDMYVGEELLFEYTGLLDVNKEIQDINIISSKQVVKEKEDLFANYYLLAQQKLEQMTLEEKIGQLLLVRYEENDALKDLKNYYLSGFVFYEKDFRGKDKKSVKQMINNLNQASKIPLLTAVDEEGGLVVRVSSNPKLRDKPFASSQKLFKEGGLEAIKEDTIEKGKLLYELGLNVNLAPVVDVSTSESDYMYSRTLGSSTSDTANFAKEVISSSKNSGVSFTLKHFPGYANNRDTHNDVAIDDRDLEQIKTRDLPPFISGINAGAESILVSHNVVKSIDEDNPASLSLEVHKLLKDELNFSGVIITDDLDMGAVLKIDDAIIKAIKAENDLIICTNYKQYFDKIKKAIENNSLTKEEIDQHVIKILAWKLYKGLINDNEK